MALSSVIGVDAASAQVNLAGPITLTGNYGLDLDTVNLDKPVQFRWRTTPSTTVLIDQKEVIQNV